MRVVFAILFSLFAAVSFAQFRPDLTFPIGTPGDNDAIYHQEGGTVEKILFGDLWEFFANKTYISNDTLYFNDTIFSVLPTAGGVIQTLTWNPGTRELAISSGNTVYITQDADSSATNEIQTPTTTFNDLTSVLTTELNPGATSDDVDLSAMEESQAIIDTAANIRADMVDSLDVYDIVGTMVSGNNEVRITVTYNAVDHKLNFVVDLPAFGDLTDVTLTSPADSSLVFYDALSGTWMDGPTIDELRNSGGLVAVSTDVTLDGDGTPGDPLSIAQQGATDGQPLEWSTSNGRFEPGTDDVDDADANASNELQTPDFSFDPVTDILTLTLNPGSSQDTVHLADLASGGGSPGGSTVGVSTKYGGYFILYTDPDTIATTAGEYHLPSDVTDGELFDFSVVNGRLVYTGVDTFMSRIMATTAITATSNNFEANAAAFLNGVEVEKTEVPRKIGTGSDVGALALTGFIEVKPGDTIDVRFKTEVSTTLYIRHLNVTVAPVGLLDTLGRGALSSRLDIGVWGNSLTIGAEDSTDIGYEIVPNLYSYNNNKWEYEVAIPDSSLNNTGYTNIPRRTVGQVAGDGLTVERVPRHGNTAYWLGYNLANRFPNDSIVITQFGKGGILSDSLVNSFYRDSLEVGLDSAIVDGLDKFDIFIWTMSPQETTQEWINNTDQLFRWLRDTMQVIDDRTLLLIQENTTDSHLDNNAVAWGYASGRQNVKVIRGMDQLPDNGDGTHFVAESHRRAGFFAYNTYLSGFDPIIEDTLSNLVFGPVEISQPGSVENFIVHNSVLDDDADSLQYNTIILRGVGLEFTNWVRGNSILVSNTSPTTTWGLNNTQNLNLFGTDILTTGGAVRDTMSLFGHDIESSKSDVVAMGHRLDIGHVGTYIFGNDRTSTRNFEIFLGDVNTNFAQLGPHGWDLSLDPGAGEDGWGYFWDNAQGEFVLSAQTGGAVTNIYTDNGSLDEDRTLTMGSFDIQFERGTSHRWGYFEDLSGGLSYDGFGSRAISGDKFGEYGNYNNVGSVGAFLISTDSTNVGVSGNHTIADVYAAALQAGVRYDNETSGDVNQITVSATGITYSVENGNHTITGATTDNAITSILGIDGSNNLRIRDASTLGSGGAEWTDGGTYLEPADGATERVDIGFSGGAVAPVGLLNVRNTATNFPAKFSKGNYYGLNIYDDGSTVGIVDSTQKFTAWLLDRPGQEAEIHIDGSEAYNFDATAFDLFERNIDSVGVVNFGDTNDDGNFFGVFEDSNGNLIFQDNLAATDDFVIHPDGTIEIGNAPTLDNAEDEFLVWDSATKEVERRNVSSITATAATTYIQATGTGTTSMSDDTPVDLVLDVTTDTGGNGATDFTVTGGGVQCNFTGRVQVVVQVVYDLTSSSRIDFKTRPQVNDVTQFQSWDFGPFNAITGEFSFTQTFMVAVDTTGGNDIIEIELEWDSATATISLDEANTIVTVTRYE